MLRFLGFLIPLLLVGCVSIDKRVLVIADGRVTVNMNSGTSVDAKDLLDATIPLK